MDVTRRSVNFSEEEIVAMTAFVETYKHILENKKTDAVTTKEKDGMWEKVASEWAESGYPPRTGKQLREKWKNIKKDVKKKNSAEKQELLKTGGGESKRIHITPLDIQVKSIIGDVNVVGLNNVFDSDQMEQELTAKESTEENAKQQSTSDLDCGSNKHTLTWTKKWNPNLLKQPISRALTYKRINNEDGNLKIQATQSARMEINEDANPKVQPTQSATVTSVLPGKRVMVKLSSGSNDKRQETVLTAGPSKQYCNEHTELSTPKSITVRPPRRTIKGKRELTEDCRKKINVLSEAEVELIKLQIECINKEEERKNELNQLQSELMKKEAERNWQHSKEIHMYEVEKKKIELEILKKKLGGDAF